MSGSPISLSTTSGSQLAAKSNASAALYATRSGIREDNLPRLFEPFFTTRSSGMGMGLAISSSILEAHGGQIWASNKPEGGAPFSFSLPPAIKQEVARN